jgi:diguanylate cyclase (GGDEF)-like protein
MTAPWDEAVRDLRGEFLKNAATRLDEARTFLTRLERDPADAEAQQGLFRRLHSFVGSGTLYGFPRVSTLAVESERSLKPILDSGERPQPDDLERWREVLVCLHHELFASEPDAPTPALAQAKPDRPFDVLLADANGELGATLTRLLEQEEMSARMVRTRAEALTAIQARLPDGLVTAVSFPDGSAYGLVEHLRALPHGDAVAVLMVSPLVAFPDKVEAIHCGTDGYFEEPLDWEALMRRLQHLLERNRAAPPRILAVEDDPTQAAYLKAILEAARYDVCLCTDPKRFEAELLLADPDLVLMDIVLPGVAGYDLVRYLRQDERYATLPVLFLSTESELAARIAVTRAGGDDHLVKPVPPPLLLSAVAARVERARFLRSLLDKDGLTRLLTHTAFLERARAVLARKSRQPARPFAWVMIDLDRFKAVNDTWGHPVGDRVLAAVAALLRRRLRQSDTVGRYGGEEFAVLLEDLSLEEAMRLVSRLLEEFSALEHQAPNGERFRLSFSAGIAMLEPGMDVDVWRQGADQALYAAKDGGRCRVVAAPSRP